MRGAAFLRAAVLGTWCLLAGCSSLYDYEPTSYVVRRGDTLYSIAFSHGIDYRDLAAWNSLANPDRIYVGQRLALSPAGRPAARPAAAAGSVTARGSAASNEPAGSSRPAAPSPAARPRSDAAPPSWRGPVDGRVISRFGAAGELATGIAIAGRLGQAVRTAAPGRVVYVGSGLPAYGQLIIIQHNETWLSAYGHNQRVLVSQGQQVTAGQKIAEMGPGPGGEPRLHFEIRRDGEPLDPLTLLPGSG
jgi:lipoprotein NlpD